MGPIVTKRKRLANRHFGVGILFIIRIVIVIRWKQRVLAGTDGMMDRVVSAAAVQSSKAAVTFAAAAIVRMRARGGRLKTAHCGKKQAGEDKANKHFGDRSHSLFAMLKG